MPAVTVASVYNSGTATHATVTWPHTPDPHVVMVNQFFFFSSSLINVPFYKLFFEHYCSFFVFRIFCTQNQLLTTSDPTPAWSFSSTRRDSTWTSTRTFWRLVSWPNRRKMPHSSGSTQPTQTITWNWKLWVEYQLVITWIIRIWWWKTIDLFYQQMDGKVVMVYNMGTEDHPIAEFLAEVRNFFPFWHR